MGIHADKQTYERVRELLGISPGEPIFVIRAQDIASIPALTAYAFEADDAGASEEFVASICDAKREDSVCSEFMRWQDANPDKVKIPD